MAEDPASRFASRQAERERIAREAEESAAARRERVRERLGRIGSVFQRNRTQEERDVLEAYRTQTPVEEIRRRRGAAGAGAAAAPAPSMAGPDEIRQAQSRAASPMMEVSAPDEVAAALSRSRAQRAQRLPNTRLSPRAAQREASADELNQRELDRIGLERIRDAEREEERRRLSSGSAAQGAEMGGSGDIGAASARARGEQVGPPGDYNMKKGGRVKKMAKGGAVKMAAGGASRRGDGCAARGKTKGRMV